MKWSSIPHLNGNEDYGVHRSGLHVVIMCGVQKLFMFINFNIKFKDRF